MLELLRRSRFALWAAIALSLNGWSLASVIYHGFYWEPTVDLTVPAEQVRAWPDSDKAKPAYYEIKGVDVRRLTDEAGWPQGSNVVFPFVLNIVLALLMLVEARIELHKRQASGASQPIQEQAA